MLFLTVSVVCSVNTEYHCTQKHVVPVRPCSFTNYAVSNSMQIITVQTRCFWLDIKKDIFFVSVKIFNLILK